MTREQQQKLRELKKELSKMLKEKIKKYNFKKKDFMIWESKNGLFLDCFIYVGVTNDNRCFCTTREKIKPLWLDDLLWELGDM